MENRKVAIIGHFGNNGYILDGQTIKTRILFEELERCTDWHIQKVDTYFFRRNPLKLLGQTLKALCTAKDIILLVSGNGMRIYFPILYFWGKCCGTRVYHDVIGGNLARYVQQIPSYVKYLNSFQKNWVETRLMQEELIEQGVRNAEVVPNFKRLTIAAADELQPVSHPYRFCTFSRVVKEKGIEDAIAAVENINRKSGIDFCQLDIFGTVDPGYAARFEELMKTVSDRVRYRGTVPYDESVGVLKEYYALLFPTFWKGEGFAGTIVDAFSAGIPVVATDWRCNGEIVQNEVTGLLYPGTTAQDLESAIAWLINNPERVAEMKKNCTEAAARFQPDQYISRMVDEIESF